jgi:hypothetical protein
MERHHLASDLIGQRFRDIKVRLEQSRYRNPRVESALLREFQAELEKLEHRNDQAKLDVMFTTVHRLERGWSSHLSTTNVPASVPLLGEAQNTKEDKGAVSPSDAPSLVLNGLDEEVLVFGISKGLLTEPQYRVLEELLKAKAEGKRLTIDQLCRRSDVEDPRHVLIRLRDRDADWRDLIDMAGKRGRGYGLNDTRPRRTQKNPQRRPRRPTRG